MISWKNVTKNLLTYFVPCSWIDTEGDTDTKRKKVQSRIQNPIFIKYYEVFYENS